MCNGFSSLIHLFKFKRQGLVMHGEIISVRGMKIPP
jgi:hypothetical protein